MARFVISHKLAGKRDIDSSSRSAEAMEKALSGPLLRGAGVHGHHDPGTEGGRRIATVESSEADMKSLQRELHPDVLVEKEVRYRPPPHHPVAFARDVADSGSTVGVAKEVTTTLDVRVMGESEPIEGATIGLLLSGGGGPMQASSDASGEGAFTFAASLTPSKLMAVPAAGYWSLVVSDPPNPTEADCIPLPSADDNLGWWHRLLGDAAFDPTRGRGVSVGVVDSGLAPHPALREVKSIGSFLGGKVDPSGGGDVGFHGTYACGIIAAAPGNASGFGGFAPGATVLSARIFDAEMGSNQGDIALAVHQLAMEHQVDLINLSLSADTVSTVLHDAIVHALENGALCICSAGNVSVVDGKPSRAVTSPASFAETVAVGALGRTNWGPASSGSAQKEPAEADQFGEEGLYLANLSCYGPGLDCVAPGVGIISTVPPKPGMAAPFLAMDGTSASSPAVCGALAARLAGLTDYLALGRDKTRADMARRVLTEACRSVGLKPEYEGTGVPRL